MIDKTLSHDPSEYIRGLQQLLVSDKKRIGFLFGAGTSLAKKNKESLNIPAIGKMTVDIVNIISEEKDIYSDAIEEIRKEIGEKKFSIETMLSNIELKTQIIGKGSLNGLRKEDFESLSKKIKEEVLKMVSIHNTIKDNVANVIHVDFAEWIGRAKRNYPIEIFTTNYDYLFELGLEHKNIPFYDGFTGSFKPFFHSESIEDMSFLPQQTKLWKIHGSLGWHFDNQSKKVWRKDSDNEDLLIYPSSLKYDESKKQPYTALGDRLSNFLKLPDSILITCGYSFSDDHINERILTSLDTNNSAHVFALYYDIYWEDSKKKFSLRDDVQIKRLAKDNPKLSVFGCRDAILGRKMRRWQLKKEPDRDDTINTSVYFDEDAPELTSEIGNEEKGNEVWTGEGELKLPDFSKFVAFLHSMMLTSSQTEKK